MTATRLAHAAAFGALLSIAMVFGLGPAAIGCSAAAPTTLQAEARVASTIADVANAGLPVLSAAYTSALSNAIRQAALDEDAAAAKEHRPTNRGPAMDAAESRVVHQWDVVWAFWAAFRAAHTAWATAIEAGQDGKAEEQQMRETYCALGSVVPDSARSMLSAVVSCTAADAGVPISADAANDVTAIRDAAAGQ
jgi:hypothetical protein